MTRDYSFLKLNDPKDAFAEAYIFALSAAAGVSVERTTRRTDNKGIDLILTNGNKSVFTSQINVQLKGVSENRSNMFQEVEDTIKYYYSTPCQPCMFHYLIVVRLPSDADTSKWMTWTQEELILRKRAYFLRIEPNLKPGFVVIPNTNILTTENLKTLFPTLQSFREGI